MNNIWKILEINCTSDEKLIKQAYLKKLKKSNPEDNAEAFQELRKAYEIAIAYSREFAKNKTQNTENNLSNYAKAHYPDRVLTYSNTSYCNIRKKRRDSNYIFYLAHKLVRHACVVSEDSAIRLFGLVSKTGFFENIDNGMLFADSIFSCFIQSDVMPYNFFHACLKYYDWNLQDYRYSQLVDRNNITELRQTIALMDYINHLKTDKGKTAEAKIWGRILINFKGSDYSKISLRGKKEAIRFIGKLKAMYPQASFSFLKMPNLLQFFLVGPEEREHSLFKHILHRIMKIIMYIVYLLISLMVAFSLMVIYFVHKSTT